MRRGVRVVPPWRGPWIVLIALLAACSGDKSVAPAAFTLTGSWIGTASGTTVVMNLTQTNKDVSGTGTFADNSGGNAITIFGTYDANPLTLTINFPNTVYKPITFSGAVTSATSITGTLNGSGYNNFALSFQRQP